MTASKDLLVRDMTYRKALGANKTSNKNRVCLCAYCHRVSNFFLFLSRSRKRPRQYLRQKKPLRILPNRFIPIPLTTRTCLRPPDLLFQKCRRSLQPLEPLCPAPRGRKSASSFSGTTTGALRELEFCLTRSVGLDRPFQLCCEGAVGMVVPQMGFRIRNISEM